MEELGKVAGVRIARHAGVAEALVGPPVVVAPVKVEFRVQNVQAEVTPLNGFQKKRKVMVHTKLINQTLMVAQQFFWHSLSSHHY